MGRTTYRCTWELQIHRGLEKWQSTLLIQIRTEKIRLRDFLWERKVLEVDDPGCNCGEGRPTIGHIMMRCPKHRNLRRREIAYKGEMSLSAILSKLKLVTKEIRS